MRPKTCDRIVKSAWRIKTRWYPSCPKAAKRLFSRMKYTYILLLETSQESQGHFQEISISFQLDPKVTWQDEPNKHCLLGLLTISNSIRSCFLRRQGYVIQAISNPVLKSGCYMSPRSMTNKENSPTSDEEQFGTSWSVYPLH